MIGMLVPFPTSPAWRGGERGNRMFVKPLASNKPDPLSDGYNYNRGEEETKDKNKFHLSEGQKNWANSGRRYILAAKERLKKQEEVLEVREGRLGEWEQMLKDWEGRLRDWEGELRDWEERSKEEEEFLIEEAKRISG